MVASVVPYKGLERAKTQEKITLGFDCQTYWEVGEGLLGDEPKKRKLQMDNDYS